MKITLGVKMEKIKYGNKDTHSLALCIKDTAATANSKIMSSYILPLSRISGTPLANDLCTLPLYYPTTGNIKKKDIVTMSEELLEYCDTVGIDTLLVADGKYFEYLSGVKGLERQTGNKFQCALPEYGHITIIPVLSYLALEMSPDKQVLQDKAFARVVAELKGEEIVEQVFEFKHYEVLKHPDDLAQLLQYPELAIDIETTGLRFEHDELVTIAFAWSDTEAVTIPIHRTLQESNGIQRERLWKQALKDFFMSYTGTKIFHNYLFDAKFLVRHLFMGGPLDYVNRSMGARYLDSEDTMIMAFCCLNSTSRVSLGLKDLAFEYVGDYAVGVKDVLALDPKELYEYNAKDVVATFWVYNKYSKMLITEDQMYTYRTIMQPSLNYLLNMMLSGLPVSKSRVVSAKEEIGKVFETALHTLRNNNYTRLAVSTLKELAADKYNSKTKVKKKIAADFEDLEFNPNSSAQLRVLLFDVMGYTPLEFTPKKMPKTNRDSIEEFQEEEPLAERREVLDALIQISETSIILTTFLSAFETLWFDVGDEDLGRLYGNQRLGGTATGRLSANSPNFANMPSGSTYGEEIKSCFRAPEGWLFWASDYAALEDRVGAQVTGDVNKRKEFLEGFDGHSLRAYAFFKDEVDELLGEELDPSSPESINRIKHELPEIRGKSKSPSFAMAYGSGAPKIQALLKCSKAKSEVVFNAYHELYKGTADFAKKLIQEAKNTGYVIGAFGLKLRTPRINSKDNKVASKEGRTLNNMAIQSYGLLMNRAGIALQKKIEDASLEPDVVIINQIHDALYGLIRNTPEKVQWLNDNLIEVMVEDYVEGQVVHNEAELDLGYSWDDEKTLKNNASLEEVTEFLSTL